MDALFITTLLETSWRGGLAIVALLLLRSLVRGSVPRMFIHAAWFVIAVRLLLPVSLPVESNAWKAITAPPPEQLGVLLDVLTPMDKSSTTAEAKVPAEIARIPAEQKRLWTADGWTAAFVVWLVGVAILGGSRVLAEAQFWRRVRRSGKSANPALRAAVEGACARLRVASGIRVLETNAVVSPAVSGLFRPSVLFPPDFDRSLTAEELRWVALHEVAHWSRKDLWSQTLLEWTRIVHWFNPLVWLSTRIARLDCELACDEFVMRRAASAEPAAYGAALLKIVGVVRGQARVSHAVGIFENKQQLKKRIQMIAKFRTTTWSRVLLGSVMLGTVAFAGLAKEVKAETAPLQPITQEAPKGWYKNGNEDDMPHYVVGLDATQPHVAPVSAYVKSISSEVKQFGGMMQNFNAADYIGKRVRFSAWIKTKDVARSANLWMRIDGSKRSMKFDNMNDRAPKGTTDWAHFSVVLDVPDEATGIFMGFFVGGTGHAWFNDPKFEVVDPIVAETDMKRNIPR